MDGALANYDLTAPQFAVLALLSVDPGISSAELARRSFVTPPTMIRIVTALEEAGLIVREEQPASGRVKRTDLTDEGRARLKVAEAEVQKLEDVLEAKADAKLTQAILTWLNACADELEDRQAATGRIAAPR
jgi:DNA-binding MarR family transcriptional regulator